ncbi:hypothetical protein GCM10009630_10080 [Kribbella jejuensis]|uniref:hypothetical protein n=1 Tax=Kribbella jejuensis TaxID=236068 RepID=UPI00163B2748|nr:hypothetical protein [Kribbella jejuensis]
MTDVAVEGDAADRWPGLIQEAVRIVEILHLALLKVRVDLQLVDRRDHGRGVEESTEMVDHEVADAVGCCCGGLSVAVLELAD